MRKFSQNIIYSWTYLVYIVVPNIEDTTHCPIPLQTKRLDHSLFAATRGIFRRRCGGGFLQENKISRLKFHQRGVGSW